MGAPLTTSDGQNIGALCVLDTVSDRPSFTDQQKAGLIDLADTVMRELDLRAEYVPPIFSRKVLIRMQSIGGTEGQESVSIFHLSRTQISTTRFTGLNRARNR